MERFTIIIFLCIAITISNSIYAYPNGDLSKLKPEESVRIVPSEAQYKEVNSKIIFTCIVADHLVGSSDGKEVHVVWKGPDKKLIGEADERIFSERIGKLQRRLYIRSVQERDAGSYTCEGVGADGEVFVASNTLLIYAEIQFEEEPEKVVGVEGKPVTLPCRATGNPQPDVTWKFKHKKIAKLGDQRYKATKKGLEIGSVMVSDAGTYECNAQVISHGSFKIRRIRLVVQYPPKISKPLHSSTVVSGSSASFSCPAIADPAPTYQWFKGSALKGKKMMSSADGLLQLKQVTAADESDYTCVATNKHGSDAATVDLRVAVPPALKLTQGPVAVLEGSSLVLSCKAEGSPVPSFQWRKTINQANQTSSESNQPTHLIRPILPSIINFPNHSSPSLPRSMNAHWTNNAVKSNQRHQELIISGGRVSIRTSEEGDESRLAIEGVSRKDQAVYTCQASNMAGTASTSVSVALHYLPKAEIKGSKVLYGWLGQNRTITCLGTGFPIPSLIWTRGNGKGSVLSSTPHHLITTKKASHDTIISTLQLSLNEELELSMYNGYFCMAKNQHGYHSDAFHLRRAYEPNSPRNISVFNITDTFFLLKTSDGPSAPSLASSSFPSSSSFSSTLYPSPPPAKYILPIQSWTVKYRIDSRSTDSEFMVKTFENNHHIEVNGLEGDKEYLVIVSASNQVGSSDPVKFNVKTKVSPVAYVDDELPQSDQVRMLLRTSLLNKQGGFSRHHRFKSSYWSGMSVAVTILVAGLLTILATVGTAIALKNCRNQQKPVIVPSSKRNSGDDAGEDIDNLTLKTNRKLSSVTESSPFVNKKYHCESLPKKMVSGRGNVCGNGSGGGMKSNGEVEGKKMWPMSSTLPRSTKLEVHVNRTASIMEMIEEEKKTKQSQAWKEMMKLTSGVECKEEEEEDSIMRSDSTCNSINPDFQNNNIPFNDPLKCHSSVLPPPPVEMLHKAPVQPPPRLVVQAPITQMAFDPSPVRDDDEDDISFIDDDDDEDDDVVITDHYVINNNKNLGYNKNSNFYNNNNRFYPVHNNNNSSSSNASFSGQSFRQY